MRKLAQKYATELVVIGVHSAKFPNEKDKDNLHKAVQRYELDHLVINDVDFAVWQQCACRAWPTLMFIDPQGKVIGKHEGELDYENFDGLLSQMVAEFDSSGLLDRTPVLFEGHERPATTLSFPGKVLADAANGLSIAGGKIYIADTNNNAIRVADLGTSEVATQEITGV